MARDYWNEITKIKEQQTSKGISKYGQILEENEAMTPTQRITYLEEELVDALMYLEHMKNENYNGLTADDYQAGALRTVNKAVSNEELLVNSVLGLAGETGEVADHIKKFKFQGHELNREHLAKELGDITWYIAIGAKALGYSLSEIMQMNLDKLQKRYPEGFDANRSLNREGE